MARGSLLRMIVFGLLLALAIACAILLFGTQRGRYLVHHPKRILDYVHAHRLLILLGFVAFYLLMGLLAMPVWWLQVLAGYLFGLVYGILATQVISTIAAVATRNLAHWLAGDFVHDKLEAKREKVRKLDEKLGHNGLLVVMAVRLSHVIPFGLSNYLFGLSRISTMDVGIGTFLGGMPAASFYAALGADRHRHLFKDWRFVATLIGVNAVLLLPLLVRYLRPQWFKRIGVE